MTLKSWAEIGPQDSSIVILYYNPNIVVSLIKTDI